MTIVILSDCSGGLVGELKTVFLQSEALQMAAAILGRMSRRLINSLIKCILYPLSFTVCCKRVCTYNILIPRGGCESSIGLYKLVLYDMLSSRSCSFKLLFIRACGPCEKLLK